MADKKQQIAYGKAGGEGNQGQGLTRFEIGGDPSEYFPVWVAGSMNVSTPAFLMNAEGGAYRYGALKVNGLTNLIHNGSVAYPVIDSTAGTTVWTASLLLGGTAQSGIAADGTGGKSLDALQYAIYARPYSFLSSQGAIIFANGECAWQATSQAAPQYGALKEQLTVNAAGTVTAPAAGNTTVTGAATTFTTAAFDLGIAPYNAYTPSGNLLRRGDVIELITGGNSYYYRINAITDATHVEVYPSITVNIPAASAYKLWRTGYMSSSRLVVINNTATGDVWGYYAGCGQMDGVGVNTPTLQAARVYDAGTGARQHQMAPRTSAAVDAKAQDVIYFKGFLLYGYGGGISWSAGPFPSAFPFGSADLPAGNISLFNITGAFCHFEQIGEQVYALFDNGAFIVQATGGVPEFQFYRIANIPGIAPSQILDPGQSVLYYAQARASCSGSESIYFLSTGGLTRLSGLQSASISVPVDSYDLPEANATFAAYSSKTLSYDPGTCSIVLTDHHGKSALCYKETDESWYRLDLNGAGHTNGTRCIAGGFVSRPLAFARRNLFRLPGFAYFDADFPGIGLALSTTESAGGNQAGLEVDTTDESKNAWVWATPIISLGDIYDNYQFGGFKVWARAASGSTPPVNLTWTVYGGSTPYNMTVRDAGVLDYSVGTPTSRQILSKKLDDNYLGFVLTGTFWVELAGIGIYNASTKGRR